MCRSIICLNNNACHPGVDTMCLAPSLFSMNKQSRDELELVCRELEKDNSLISSIDGALC